MTLLVAGCSESTPEVEMRYSLADSCERLQPMGADDVEPEFDDFPVGLNHFCGELLPSECIILDKQAHAELEASTDRIDIEFLGEEDRLRDRCDTDLGVRIVVVAAESTPIDPSLPVFFNDNEIQPAD